MNRRRQVNKVSINKLIFIIGLLLFCAIIARLIYLNLSIIFAYLLYADIGGKYNF